MDTINYKRTLYEIELLIVIIFNERARAHTQHY